MLLMTIMIIILSVITTIVLLTTLPILTYFLLLSCVDSSGQVTSSPLSSPTSHRGMHPSLLNPSSMGPSGSLHSPISTLSSPMNGLGSPFSVINSPMGPHSMSSPGMGYGPGVSPQVRPVTDPHTHTNTYTLIPVYQTHTDRRCCRQAHRCKHTDAGHTDLLTNPQTTVNQLSLVLGPVVHGGLFHDPFFFTV